MARPMNIEPHWLDIMLKRWAQRDLKSGSGPLGYPTESSMFRERVQFKAESREPWELTPEDFSELTQAVDKLPTHLNLAIVRHYKPWNKQALKPYFECYAYTDRHWRRLVGDAVRQLAGAMEKEAHPSCGHSVCPL